MIGYDRKSEICKMYGGIGDQKYNGVHIIGKYKAKENANPSQKVKCKWIKLK